VTVPAAALPVPSGLRQWWVLTRRLIAPTLRNGEVAVGVAVSAAATASLYIPLNRVMKGPDLGMSSYAQYLVPLIVLQAIAFASISTAFRAATDSVQGINRRFQSLPIRPLTPLAARITAAVYRCVIGLVVALACGYIIGWPSSSLAFCPWESNRCNGSRSGCNRSSKTSRSRGSSTHCASCPATPATGWHR
jgi:ABC-2 type transport system permease protein